MIKKIIVILTYLFALTACSNMSQAKSASRSIQPTRSVALNQAFPGKPSFWQGDVTTVWYRLQQIPTSELLAAEKHSTDTSRTAWIKLAVISKQFSNRTPELMTQLIAWRDENPNHTANSLFPDNTTLENLKSNAVPRHYALLLPLQGVLASSGQAVRDGFLGAYYSNKTGATISFYDTSQNRNITALYQQAISEGADRIIGPLTKDEVKTLLTGNGTNFTSPILALNYTYSDTLPSHFYEFGLSPEIESEQVADRAWEAGHKRALIIATQNEWGQRVVNTFESRWKTLGGNVSETLFFNPKTNLNQAIANLLHVSMDPKKASPHQRRHDFDVIYLLAPPQNARQIVPLLKYYYAANVPIYSTSVIFSDNGSRTDADLNGIHFADAPWALHGRGNRLNAVGRDAYLLSKEMNRLNQLPHFPLYGATGALTLTSQQQIYRRLPWTQMHDGHA